MDLYFEIRRGKTHIFCDAKESSNVTELKRIVEGILKVKPEDQRLYKDEKPMDDNASLMECGFNGNTARAQQPALIGLAIKKSGVFEELNVESVSEPPPLPDVMRGAQSDTSGTLQGREEQAI